MKQRFLGFGIIGLAFLVGAQKNAAFGFLSFLAFFTVGVTLVVEGYRKRR